MVNPNRWSWSGGPRKTHTREDAVTSNQPLVPPSNKPDSCEVSSPNGQNLQPGVARVSSRRLSNNRWSWRPNAAISVTLEDQRENEQGEKEDMEQDQSQAEKPANSPRQIKKPDTPLPPPRQKPRPSSMIAPVSSSFGASPSYSHLKSHEQRQQQQQQEEEAQSSQPTNSPTQPAAGVKNAFNRLLNRRVSISALQNKKSQPEQHIDQQGQAEPTPPPSRQQQTPRPMQPSMRHRPQLHNPQNNLRGSSAPVAHNQDQGHIDRGRITAPLPGLDENSQLQLPPATSRPTTATDAAARSLGPGTTSLPAAPAAEETGLLGRLVRRRLASKEKHGEDVKKRWISTAVDNTSLPSGAEQLESAPEPISAISETTGHETQTQFPPLNPSYTTFYKSNYAQPSETVSDTQTSSKSSVPRFLRQISKPQQTSTSMAQTTDPANRPKSKSQHKAQQTLPSAAAVQSKLRTKASFGKRFWSRTGANDFRTDDVANTETPAPPPAPRTVYVPKHAASDFSRTTYTPRHYRQSVFLGNNHNSGVRPLTAITADAREDKPEPLQRKRTTSAEKAEKAEKRRSRDLSSSKYEAPSPQELYRRLEIVKSSEVEVVTTKELATSDVWQEHHVPLHHDPSASSNGKAPASRNQSRPRSSRRHSFNLVTDPYERELTPAKSASPVEMEAPFDAPSKPPKQTPQVAPPRPKSSNAQSYTQPRTQPEEPDRQMSDYERFVADAEVAEREYNAQMWRNLARRSGHYGYGDNFYGSSRPGTADATTHRGNKRDSAYFSAGNRASYMATTTADDARNLISSGFYGQPGAAYTTNTGADEQGALSRQGSVSKRISHYIKPPKPAHEPIYEDWLAPPGRTNRASIISGIAR
ncbi:hypothetical protein EsH8_VIII_000033 [Colletotrichum jinshuiense]